MAISGDDQATMFLPYATNVYGLLSDAWTRAL